jgi:type III secretion protein U
MSEGSDGEKTEAPSPKKLRDAREKGQVAKSQEVVITATMFSVIIYVWVMWDRLTRSMMDLFDLAAQLENGDFRAQAYRGMFYISKLTISALLPLFGLVIAVAIASNYLQIGTIFSFDSITPKLEKISPASGFKKIFSKKQLVDLVKSIVKIAFLSILLFFVLKNAIGPYIASLPCGTLCIAALTAELLKKILIYSAFAFLVVAVADFAFERQSNTKKLMMTKEEVKKEHKESEGDPHIKSKRKEVAHELIFSDEGEVARKSRADMINPTHFAVAILFKEGVTPLPTVVAKGRNNRAHFIRTQAEEAGVPVFRNVALARALYARTEVLQYVPDELFGAIAEVLAWVARNKSALYNGPIGRGAIDMEVGDHRKTLDDSSATRD